MNKKDQQALDELNAYLASRDEKTNRQNDKQILAANNRPPRSPESRAALIKTTSDPAWKENQRQKTLEKNQDPIYKKNQRIGIEKRVSNPAWKENQRKAQLKKFEDPEFVKTFTESMEKRSKNKQWRDNLKKKSKKQWKPLNTPQGPFKRFGEAVIHFMKVWNLKKGGADYRMRQYLNDPLNLEFSWISVDEYIMLTGKDPFNE